MNIHCKVEVIETTFSIIRKTTMFTLFKRETTFVGNEIELLMI